MRTALRSLVARDIRSPVRCAWKYAERQPLQMREEVVPHVVFDVARGADEDPAHARNRNTPPTRPIAQQQRRVFDQLGPR